MNWYVATTVEQMTYAPPYAIGKDSIMAIISKVRTHCVPQSYSLDRIPSDYYLFSS